MKNNNFNKLQKVVCAINFDKFNDDIIKSGVSLCKQTGKTLRLVHVCEPILNNFLIPLSSTQVMWDVNDDIIKNLEEDAQKKMQTIVDSIDESVSVSHDVYSGNRFSLLESEAANDAALLIVGADKALESPFWNGSSVAIQMIKTAPSPVLVIGKGKGIDFEKKGMKMFVADDLKEGSEIVFNYATNLAVCLEDTEINHIHINDINSFNLDRDIDTDHKITLLDSLKQHMNSRTEQSRTKISISKIKYNQEIVEGDVSETLSKYIEELKPDISFYGHHKLWHSKPFGLGKVPLKAMFAHNYPVLIVK